MKEKLIVFSLLIFTITIVIYSFLEKPDNPPAKIGVLMIGESRYEKYNGLKRGMAELGFKDDELKFIVKSANDDVNNLQGVIEELLDESPDLVVTLGGVETLQMKHEMEQLNKFVPVVFAGVAAPKEVGLIDDFLRPPGLFTGINNHHTSISAKRLELLTDLVPEVTRIFAVYDESVELSRFSLSETKEAAKQLKIDIVPINVSDNTYAEKIKENHRKGDGLLILPSYKIESLTMELVNIIRECQLPSMALYKHEVEAGFLAGHGASFFEQGNQAARYVSSIIQGNSPSEMPVELPDEIRFMINKEIRDELGIEVNERLLAQAEIVPLKKVAKKGSADE